MGIDILVPDRICLDMAEEKMTIRICKNLITPMHVTVKDNIRVRRLVRTKKRLAIPPQSTYKLSVEARGKPPLADRDFLFESELEGAYAHIVDADIPFMCIQKMKWPIRIDTV